MNTENLSPADRTLLYNAANIAIIQWRLDAKNMREHHPEIAKEFDRYADRMEVLQGDFV